MPSRCRPPAVCPPQVIEKQKERATNYEDESDMSEWWSHASDDTFTPGAMPPRRRLHHPPLLPPPAPAVDAFVACGGNADKSGVVKRDTLVRIIKVDFGLTIDIEALIDALVSCTGAKRGGVPACVAPDGAGAVTTGGNMSASLQDTDGTGDLAYAEFRTLLVKS